MENIRIGLNVDIKRSDGRIHSAVISSVNQENQSVTVEWFERGETKGKEMDLDTILELNPQYTEAPDDEITSAMKHSDSKKSLRRTLQQSKLVNSQVDTGTKQDVKKSRTNGGRPTLSQPQGSHLLSTHHTSALSAPSINTVGMSSIPTVNSSHVSSVSHGLVNGNHHAGGDDITTNIYHREKQTAMTSSTLAAKRDADRRSNTVKEIEKLKENREKRRAHQEEQRARKQDLMEQDPGNPNWEFMAMIREFQDTLDYHPLKMTDPVKDQRITVVVRKRPLNKKETGRKEIDVVIVPNRANCIVHEPKTKVDLTKYLENQNFRFDYAMDESVTNELVYRFTAQPLVKTIFEEGFATCFAYGQTGSGKTHTMGGDFNGRNQDCTKGVYAYTARDVFRLLHKKYSKENLAVSCSFFEIYSGKLFDLLNAKAKLRVLEDGKNQVQVVGLRELGVENESDVLKLIQQGNEVRTAGTTSANSNSSRSHAVFQIILRKRGIRSKLHGKFSLIDLAGNERGADTSSSNRQTRMEGAEINKSLLALKECIRALGRKNAHLPFRASKLTLVLRDSFVGDNSRTCMIATISPGMNSCENTLNTLRYADRVKELNPDAADEDLDYPMSDTPGNLSVADSDLVFLHSKNETEYSDDLYDYQMDVDKLQILEDQLIEEHNDIFEARFKWEKQDAELLKMTDVVDYDCDTYAQKLDSLVDQKIHKLTKLKESVTNYRKQLTEEERQATKMKSSRKH